MNDDCFGKIGNFMETIWKRISEKFPFIISRSINHGKPIIMYSKLVNDAFEKAKIETGSDKVHTLAKHLSDEIYAISKATYGEKILTIKYKSVLASENSDIQIKPHAAEALSKYLGYEDYLEFITKHAKRFEYDDKTFFEFIKTHRLALLVVVLLISGVLIYNYTTRQRWMVWQNNAYVEVNFDLQKFDVNQLKIYNEDRILHFKKINPDCDYDFFRTDGNVLIWYGKNKTKALEYFTALGLHPETGKTLKPITAYIIAKHICESYKD